MATQTVAAALMQKYGAVGNKAVQAHAKDETRYGLERLPAGINNGIAKLIGIKFDQYKSGDGLVGEWYYQARGMCLEPKSVVDPHGTVVPVRGKQTMVQVPLCPQTSKTTGKTVTHEDQFARVMNELRMLGGDDFTANAKTVGDLVELAEVLNRRAKTPGGVCFKFSTSEGKQAPGASDSPRVFENWHGRKGLEDYRPDLAPAVADNTPRGETNGEPPVNRIANALPPAAQDDDVTNTNTVTPFDDGAELPGGDSETETGDAGAQADEVAALLIEANPPKRDAKAQQKLEDMAVAAGYTTDDVDKATSWEEVADMIANPKAGDTNTAGDDGEDDDAPKEPEKGDVVKYHPVDKRGKRAKSPVDCEVTAVQKKKGTCHLKNTDDPRVTYENVPWGELS